MAACADTGSINDAFQDPQCPTAMASLGPVSASGTAAFNADKSYAVSETVSGTVIVHLPPSCLMASGITLTCAQLQQEIEQADAASTPPSFASVSCAGTNGCTCTMTFAPMVTNDSGTWSTSGTNITVTSTTGTSNTVSFCVRGNELHLITVDMSIPMGPMGTVKVARDFVATMPRE
jgi:hypothetical protein